MQYQQYNETIRTAQKARLERARQESWKRFKYVGSVLLHSIEPTAELIQKLEDVNSKYPNAERCFIAGKYALKIGEIAYDEHAKISHQ